MIDDLDYLSRSTTKSTKSHVCPAKAQVSLRIRAVWPESSLCTLRIANDPWFLYADNEDSDQTGRMFLRILIRLHGRMSRLTWVFVGRTYHFVSFVVLRLIWVVPSVTIQGAIKMFIDKAFYFVFVCAFEILIPLYAIWHSSLSC